MPCLVSFLVVILGLPSAVYALSKYQGQVLDDSGRAVPSASITVYPAESPLTAALLFSDKEGFLPLPNPVFSGGNGFFEFYAVPGSYHLKISTGSGSYTLLDVPVVNPMESHTISSAPTVAPLTLIESGSPMSGNNNALTFERLDSAGLRVKGPWRIHTNKGSSGIREEFLLTYNTDFDELSSTWTGRDFPDIGLFWRWGPTTEFPYHPFIDFGVAGPGPAGTVPDFGSPGFSMKVSYDLLGNSLTSVKLGWGPLIIGNGLANSGFLTRRVAYGVDGNNVNLDGVYDTSGPMGVLVKTDVNRDFGGTDTTMRIPGEVAVGVNNTNQYDYPLGESAVRTTFLEQDFPGVFLRWGNGTPSSLVNAGKALVRIRTGLIVQRGDTLVSADSSGCPSETFNVSDGSQWTPTTVTIGCADVNNAMTDSRKILGYAIENSGDTKAGFVAIITPNR